MFQFHLCLRREISAIIRSLLSNFEYLNVASFSVLFDLFSNIRKFSRDPTMFKHNTRTHENWYLILMRLFCRILIETWLPSYWYDQITVGLKFEFTSRKRVHYHRWQRATTSVIDLTVENWKMSNEQFNNAETLNAHAISHF